MCVELIELVGLVLLLYWVYIYASHAIVMAAIKFSRLTRSLNSSLNFANGIDVRSSFACLNRSYHASESHSSRDYAARCFSNQRQCIVSSYLSRPLDNWAFRSVPFVGSLRLYSSSVGGQGNAPGGSDPPISGASGSSMSAGGSDGSEWVLKAKEGWQSVVDIVTSTGEKAKEASSEMTPYVQQVLDAHPYLRDVIAPVSGTLICTLLAWVVMPRFLRRFHKISIEGPATLLSQSSLWRPVPYEKSIWGALEGPVRYLITFMAFTQMLVECYAICFSSV